MTTPELTNPFHVLSPEGHRAMAVHFLDRADRELARARHLQVSEKP